MTAGLPRSVGATDVNNLELIRVKTGVDRMDKADREDGTLAFLQGRSMDAGGLQYF